MKNSFPYTTDQKRYHTWNYHLRETFGHKVFKVALDGGFDCPNRDGKVAYGGCTFCSAAGSGDFAGNRTDHLVKQFNDIRTKMHKKWKDGKYLGYFQAFSNTYAPVEELREKYEIILQQPDVIGLSIATRPDCLPDDVVEYLAELNERTYLWVELGLQTVHESTANLINRAHDYDCYKEGVAKLRKHGIRVCSHIIDGLPQETPEMMLETAKEVAKLDIQGIKIHLLHLLKGTPMVKQYEKGLLQFLSFEDYVNLVCDQLEILPPEIVIHRITGDGPPDLMIGPMWSLRKWEVLNAIDDELKRRDSWQGKFAVKEGCSG
ncbi:radical SAM protein, TIGR01212 family [Schinkia azotoformans MEV2011]|uniref:Radical SAM protein, TIGR01212 family n=1 Tax=Schinkia azotoformans MEV2011 TaxID=1348973 RepID=A0A072NJH5_SCHAZ|nr:TIGR01212 family radical SAM protein [Schinkia azotoformans]KEF37591.1 radical SAM protein, TIGR01212 family [Schinkia azotoformans MEV2011]MEC1695317.1 TIGR01212 family radical SAM protein [Schinkia azotoformans]MEC1717884.1 TIGR01212 family radical SAM protein [Schinkia azotoformans]MEC1724659.1 TIGR01212 family radical SAM protein [Schinkia azotoformans]MEC1741084.1 TIGR01212 family radical SAM protein [Schinkia azotoformans]